MPEFIDEASSDWFRFFIGFAEEMVSLIRPVPARCRNSFQVIQF